MNNTQNLANTLAEILPAYDTKKWEEVLNKSHIIRKGAQVAFSINKKQAL